MTFGTRQNATMERVFPPLFSQQPTYSTRLPGTGTPGPHHITIFQAEGYAILAALNWIASTRPLPEPPLRHHLRNPPNLI